MSGTGDLTRRDFLTACALGGCALCLGGRGSLAGDAAAATPYSQGPRLGGIFYTKEAAHYEKLPNERVRCKLCPNLCEVGDQERGYCGVRENRGGTYYSLVYGNPCVGYDGGMVDPIEKKPLFHFLPGTTAYSTATAGCNVECKFCQNWDISQSRPEQTQNFDVPPAKLVEKAKQNRSASIAFTYSEPVVYYEYALDTAVLARQFNVHAVMISNGYIERDPMKDLVKHLSAVKIDLKAFTEKFYKELVNGKLEPVLKTLQLLKDQGTWFEIVYLVIPTHNDSPAEIRDMSRWIAKNLGRDVPVHYTSYHPTYKLNLPPTPLSTVETARKVSMDEGLRYVYVGNVPHGPEGHPGESTYCGQCGKRVIHRVGFRILDEQLDAGRCSFCHAAIPGVWA